jgi:hypothetical protein
MSRGMWCYLCVRAGQAVFWRRGRDSAAVSGLSANIPRKSSTRGATRVLSGLQFGAAAGLHFNGRFPQAAIAEDGKSETHDKNNEDQIIDLQFSVLNCELKRLGRKIIEVVNGKKDDAKNGNDSGVVRKPFAQMD